MIRNNEFLLTRPSVRPNKEEICFLFHIRRIEIQFNIFFIIQIVIYKI